MSDKWHCLVREIYLQRQQEPEVQFINKLKKARLGGMLGAWVKLDTKPKRPYFRPATPAQFS